MAYFNQEMKIERMPAIKSVLKKYNCKGTVSVDGNRTLKVTLSEGFDFIPFMNPSYTDKSIEQMRQEKYNYSVNPYWIEQHWTGKAKDMLLELEGAMKGNDWFDKSDIMTDYFNTAFYINISIGRWDKPYLVTC